MPNLSVTNNNKSYLYMIICYLLSEKMDTFIFVCGKTKEVRGIELRTHLVVLVIRYHSFMGWNVSHYRS